MEESVPHRLERLIRDDGRYPLEAYGFLFSALDYTTRRIYGEAKSSETTHVSGEELCDGAREFAVLQWGALARDVLKRWRICQTRDFGEMVFLLVDNNFMGHQDTDCIEDFDGVYDFDDAFSDYEIGLEHDDN